MIIAYIIKKLTKNYKKIPLLSVFVNDDTFKDIRSIEVFPHPSFKDDEYLKEKLTEISKYIRYNYDKGDFI